MTKFKVDRMEKKILSMRKEKLRIITWKLMICKKQVGKFTICAVDTDDDTDDEEESATDVTVSDDSSDEL